MTICRDFLQRVGFIYRVAVLFSNLVILQIHTSHCCRPLYGILKSALAWSLLVLQPMKTILSPILACLLSLCLLTAPSSKAVTVVWDDTTDTQQFSGSWSWSKDNLGTTAHQHPLGHSIRLWMFYDLSLGSAPAMEYEITAHALFPPEIGFISGVMPWHRPYAGREWYYPTYSEPETAGYLFLSVENAVYKPGTSTLLTANGKFGFSFGEIPASPPRIPEDGSSIAILALAISSLGLAKFAKPRR